MTFIQRGFRGKIEDYFNLRDNIRLDLVVIGDDPCDSFCFVLNEKDKLFSDSHLISQDLASSPEGAIVLERPGNYSLFSVNLSLLPARAKKLAFALKINGEGFMNEIRGLMIVLSQRTSWYEKKKNDIRLYLGSSDFGLEKTLIGLEFYKTDSWRFSAVASGVEGGFPGLLKRYGGADSEFFLPEEPFDDYIVSLEKLPLTQDPAPKPDATPDPKPDAKPSAAQDDKPASRPDSKPSSYSPEKEPEPLKRSSPKGLFNRLFPRISSGLFPLVSQNLSPSLPLKIVLENHGLRGGLFRSGLVMDISGSMVYRYQDDTVKDLLERIIPFSTWLDESGKVDFWCYGTRPLRMTSLELTNYKIIFPGDWRALMEALGHGNDEIAVMRLVLDEYEKSHAPAYIIFVTDGGFASESSLRDFLVKSSHLPIFWRFLGFGEENSQMFHRLNWLPGRYTINADFSLISDFKQMNKEYFYDTLLGKFPLWLREASKLGIVPK